MLANRVASVADGEAADDAFCSDPSDLNPGYLF